MHGLSNPMIRAAPADVPLHRRVNISIARFRILRQKRHGRHDLSGLTVPTLRDVHFDPGTLHRMAAVRRKTLNRRDFLPDHRRSRSDARSRGFSIDVHGAGAAQSHAAAKLGARHAQRVAQHPQQRHVWRHVHRLRFSVHYQLNRHASPPHVYFEACYCKFDGQA